MAQQTARIVTDDTMGGEPRIAGHRVTVLQIRDLVEERGHSPHAVADRYGLDVAAVYRALAYYHEHPREMREVRERRQSVVAEHREESHTPDEFDGQE